MSAQNDFSIHDYADFLRYEEANKALGPPSADEKRVVFMGNSITEAWVNYSPDFFSDNNYIGRGISGQVTHQMLIRFRADVIALKPKLVVILAGTNDIAQNSGPVSLEEVADNIKVIICSVLPAKDYPWKPGMNPLNKIPKLNSMIKEYATANDLSYVDFFEVMDNGKGGMKVPEHTTENDLVHPNKAGYLVMEALIKNVIESTFK